MNRTSTSYCIKASLPLRPYLAPPGLPVVPPSYNIQDEAFNAAALDMAPAMQHRADTMTRLTLSWFRELFGQVVGGGEVQLS